MKSRTEAGFTLVELLLVVAVVAILAVLLIPVVLGIVNDAKDAKAKADVRASGGALANAMLKFFTDVGEWPTRDADGPSGAEINLLYSGTTAPTLSDFASPPGSSYDCSNPSNCEGFSFPFVTNNSSSNAYPTTGRLRWKGRYLSDDIPDEFGMPYIIYVSKLRRSGGDSTARAWILSAGPNKLYETTPGSIVPQGDDIAFSLK